MNIEKYDGHIAEQSGFKIKLLQTEEEASKVVDFFFSEHSFDDRTFTPGEVEQLKTDPFLSLVTPKFQYWFALNEKEQVIGAVGVRENEQKSGGYIGDYFAVHRLYRHLGLAPLMMEIQEDYIQAEGGRYLVIPTGDSNFYEPIRNLLAKRKYTLAGHLPDYYCEGEGLVYYIKKMNIVS